MHARKVLYQLSYIPSPIYLFLISAFYIHIKVEFLMVYLYMHIM